MKFGVEKSMRERIEESVLKWYSHLRIYEARVVKRKWQSELPAK